MIYIKHSSIYTRIQGWFTISLEMPVPSQSHYVFTVFRLLTDFVCLYNYEFWLSLCKIVRSLVILLLPYLRWSIFKQYLTPRKICTIFKLLFCRKYTLLYAVIMCFIIISQVQSKNNKQWNTVTNSTGEQFECDRLICKPYQQWNEVNILILIFTVPSNLLVRKVIR